ncbi:hypothetical protein GQ53DRAFT_751602 [Thozetella sp. PMI_491]|nr:hypothetical protein GQ53DRAFT_751602 [Thozetella sp. PMI_491]
MHGISVPSMLVWLSFFQPARFRADPVNRFFHAATLIGSVASYHYLCTPDKALRLGTFVDQGVSLRSFIVAAYPRVF